jgi:uncharacterized protein YbjT (DUF2867 family)
MKILITGGSGHLGRAFVRAAAHAGHVPRTMSRRPAPADPTGEWVQTDLSSGTGLVDALAGVDVVVHAASDPRTAAETDVEGTRGLVAAARAAGVAHFLYVSIVGIDRIPFGYYKAKLAAEGIVGDSGIPHSILRAAQFHYFIDMLLHAAGRVPLVLPLPAGFRAQSIAISDVVPHMLDAIASGPGGMLPDLVGPRAMSLREAARIWQGARGKSRPIVGLPIPGAVAAAFRAGHNTAPDHPSGTVTWEAWLANRYRGR